jgi:hypothetical protein
LAELLPGIMLHHDQLGRSRAQQIQSGVVFALQAVGRVEEKNRRRAGSAAMARACNT